MVKRSMRIIFYISALVLITIPGICTANGLSFADNQVFPHGYVDYDRIGPLAMADYPFASSGRKLVFQTSYRSLYGMKELTDSRAAVAITRDRYNAGIAIATFGEPDYFHQLGFSAFVSYRRDYFSLGGALIYSRLSFNDKYDPLSMITANLGASYRREKIAAFILTRSLNQPKYSDYSPAIMPEFEIGLSYKSGEGLDSQAKALFVRHQKPTAELSQSFRLGKYARINWALVLLPARFGGGLNLEKGHFAFDYKLSHHPVLGMTHTVMLTIFKPKA
jgi:hypothetical protein